ncbi:hypothetical protein HK102_003518, partial [Quaeritorhiza haematococci]
VVGENAKQEFLIHRRTLDRVLHAFAAPTGPTSKSTSISTNSSKPASSVVTSKSVALPQGPNGDVSSSQTSNIIFTESQQKFLRSLFAVLDRDKTDLVDYRHFVVGAAAMLTGELGERFE